jgi:hypothetical protein
VIEELPTLPGDGVAALRQGVVDATGASPAQAGEELERVLALGALVADPAPGGVRWRWAES